MEGQSSAANGTAASVKERIRRVVEVPPVPPIDFSFMVLAPSDAKELLGKNHKNRNLSPATVARYVADIKADAWALTHQAIAVGPDGELVDGQHRLTAIVEAGVPVLVVFAIYRDARMAEEARQKVDIGRVRRAGDVFEIGGVTEKGLGQRVCAVTLALLAVSDPRPWGSMTPAMMKAAYESNRLGVDFAVALPGRFFPAPIAGAYAYAFPVSPEKITEFASIVTSKIGITPLSAAAAYVQALSTGTLALTGKAQGARVEVSYRVLRLLEAHLEGETVSKVQLGKRGLEYFQAARAKAGLS